MYEEKTQRMMFRSRDLRVALSNGNALIFLGLCVAASTADNRTLPQRPKTQPKPPLKAAVKPKAKTRPKPKSMPSNSATPKVQGKATPPVISLPTNTKEFIAARQIGMRLLQRYKAGALTLINPERDEPQIRAIAKQGYFTSPQKKPVIYAPLVLQTLDRLTARASKQKPLVLMGLYRPASRPDSREPHSLGMAIDIAAYQGFTIHGRNPKVCEAGVLAVLQSLGKGEYSLGLPKPPNTDPVPLLPPPRRPQQWPFFPAPLPVVYDLLGVRLVAIAPVTDSPVKSDNRSLPPLVARWENERGAPLADIGSQRVRAALRTAPSRGITFRSLFPDALDHLHLHVSP